jgi:DNA modification methylase
MSSKQSKKTNSQLDRITEYVSTDAPPDYIAKTEIPHQPDFYKIPRRFGAVPVDELPLLCDKNEQYYKLYPKISLPFQKAGSISFGHSNLEPNRLFWGDNLHVMRMLPSNSIDLIYIDPPFFSGRDYNVIFGDANEVRSFSDIWDGGMPGYLVWLNARLLEMKRLLKPTGSIYIHLDSHASHYVKVELDKIFGYDNFKNDIIWKRTHAHGGSQKYGPVHDTIFFYSKSDDYVWEQQSIDYSEKYINDFFKKDKDGKLYRATILTGSGIRHGSSGKPWRGIDPTKRGRHWAIPGYLRNIIGETKSVQEALEKLDGIGRIIWPEKELGVPSLKQYKDDMEGAPLQDTWTDIQPLSGKDSERLGYPTQKPEKLIERIIMSSSKEGDLVADFFCGGGTTPVVAHRLGRRWIACDQSRVAVAITQGRIESLYERAKEIQTTLTPMPDISLEYWGTYETPTLNELTDDEFKNFVVSAYGGRIASAGTYIHGFKREVPLYVGPASQDKLVTKDDVVNFAREIAVKRGKDQGTMLAWAFSPSAKSAVEKLKMEGNPEVELIQISPIEIESPQFREHVVKLHKEYESFLRFILPPEIRFTFKRVKPLTYLFDVSESIPLNAGAKIINVQWDFDFRGRFTPAKGFTFGRDSKGNPLHRIEFKFNSTGKRSIACRIQDDVGGEKIYPEIISVH